MRPKWLKGWTTVRVDWIDTITHPVGDLKDAAPSMRHTLGYFQTVKERDGKKVLVISDTRDDDVEGQQGWTAIPLANVTKIVELIDGEKEWKP